MSAFLTATEKQEPFWMVLVSNSDHTRVRHMSFEAAQSEAARLAAKHNIGVYILQTMGEVTPVPPPTPDFNYRKL